MKILDWLRKPGDSVEELTEQLKAAEASCEAAEVTVLEAVATFDNTGTEKAAKALRVAREAVTLADDHEARAQRLLAQAQANEAQSKRDSLKLEIRKLEQEFCNESLDRISAPFAKKEAALLLEIAKVRAEKYAESKTFALGVSRLNEARVELEGEHAEQLDKWSVIRRINGLNPVLEEVSELRTNESEDTVSQQLHELAKQIAGTA